MHDEQLRAHGGAAGLRDAGLLQSALARPLNRASYEALDVVAPDIVAPDIVAPDIVALGGVYALAIARNHPFLDGNKRTAFAALVTFLALNGVAFDPPEADAVLTMLAMAAGDLGDDGFIAWLRQHAHMAETAAQRWTAGSGG